MVWYKIEGQNRLYKDLRARLRSFDVIQKKKNNQKKFIEVFYIGSYEIWFLCRAIL